MRPANIDYHQGATPAPSGDTPVTLALPTRSTTRVLGLARGTEGHKGHLGQALCRTDTTDVDVTAPRGLVRRGRVESTHPLTHSKHR